MKLRDGTQIGCRKCWQCSEGRVDNWVGRCIAESKTNAVSVFLTLTYGRDAEGNESHERAAILTYSDVQKFFKNMRFRGLRFRYLVVGEIGSKKGRTHWHVIVFFEHDLPETFTDFGMNAWHRAKRDVPVEVPMIWNKRYNNPLWPHGFSQWEPLHYGHEQGGVRYACKYINKDVDDDAAQSKLAMSKRPPLAAVYFDKRAKKMVDEGVSPQDAFYTFPNQARRKNGDIVRFQLKGKSLELFIENYVRRWHGYPPFGYEGPPTMERGEHWPYSQMIEDHFDKKLRQRFAAGECIDGVYGKVTREGKHVYVETYTVDQKFHFKLPDGFKPADVRWHHIWPYVEDETGPLYYGLNMKGKFEWQRNIPIEAENLPMLPRGPNGEWTQHQLLVRLGDRVQWISDPHSLGFWKLAKLQPGNSKHVWLQSLMR